MVVCAGPFSTLGSAPARRGAGSKGHTTSTSPTTASTSGACARSTASSATRAGVPPTAARAFPGCRAPSPSRSLGAGEPPERARVTLFIGAANPKGRASVRAMVERLGRPVRTAGGERPGFGDPQTVPLPPPFGPRTAYTFDGPEHDLFPALLGVRRGRREGRVRASARQRGLRPARAHGRALGPPHGARSSRGSRPLAPRVGATGGAVLVELVWKDGRRAARALVAGEEGQRMASLPCALVARRPGRGRVARHRSAAADGGGRAGGAPVLAAGGGAPGRRRLMRRRPVLRRQRPLRARASSRRGRRWSALTRPARSRPSTSSRCRIPASRAARARPDARAFLRRSRPTRRPRPSRGRTSSSTPPASAPSSR